MTEMESFDYLVITCMIKDKMNYHVLHVHHFSAVKYSLKSFTCSVPRPIPLRVKTRYNQGHLSVLAITVDTSSQIASNSVFR